VNAVVDPDSLIVIDNDDIPSHEIDLSLDPKERFKAAAIA